MDQMFHGEKVNNFRDDLQAQVKSAVNHTNSLYKPSHRKHLTRRLMIWGVVLIALPTFLCASWLGQLSHQAIRRNHTYNVKMLSQTLAAALVARGDSSLSDASGRLLDVLNHDTRLAFVAVIDAQGNVLHRRTADADAWSAYHQWFKTHVFTSQIDVNQPVYPKKRNNLVVYKVPIWKPLPGSASWGEASSASASTNRLEGYLVLAMNADALGMMMARLGRTQWAMTFLIVLVAGLLAIWGVRRWTQPVQMLLAATEQLSQGLPPSAIPIHRQDELGILSDAFNRMARRLFATRRRLMRINDQLLETNIHLEQKVQQRTHALTCAIRQLRAMAGTDPLTGLANRRAFDQAMTRCFAYARRNRTEMACVMIDLDGFKPLNDSLGHAMGDRLLVQCARVLTSICRSEDVAGRLGGDEFVLLLPGADIQTATLVAQRVHQTFLQAVGNMNLPADLASQITMSLGLACLGQSPLQSPTQLLHWADQALYCAKSQGKNRLVVFDPHAYGSRISQAA